MHRIAATPGGWSPGQEGVVFIDQTPGDLVVLTAADSDIQTLAAALGSRDPRPWQVRAQNLLNLQQQLTIDHYADTVLSQTRVILLRLLGGRSYWSYGLEVLQELAERRGIRLLVLPGDDRPDPDLLALSTVPVTVADRAWRYCQAGGPENWRHLLQYLGRELLGSEGEPPPPPLPLAEVLPYNWQEDPGPAVGILFYRAHVLAGNLAPIDALLGALRQRGLRPRAIAVPSLRDPAHQQRIRELWGEGVELVLNGTGFAIARLDEADTPARFWADLNVPVLQLLLAGGTREQWLSSDQGLGPRDLAMQVALPEVDGRITTRPISFKAAGDRHPELDLPVVGYAADPERIAWVADLSRAWVDLRRTPVAERRLALIFANYPNRDGRLANGVGLDSPASGVAILQALAAAGYDLSDLPADGEALIRALTGGVTNDPEGLELRPVRQWLSLADYEAWFATLPTAVRQRLLDRWGPPAQAPDLGAGGFAIAGLQLGSVFVGIQPARGYDLDPSLNYHAPDLEPPHRYLAFYVWLRQRFGVQAIVHVGKHGNLEWLPGKSLALSGNCFPEVALGPLPHFYPFIVNDPGEGSQAKRRAQAVILDHLTPPLTRAELYGDLLSLEGLVDEWYEAQGMDPARLPLLQEKIQTLAAQSQLAAELAPDQDWGDWLTGLDGYLCELKEAQIRDGLHIFGHCPQGQQLRDLLVAIARAPGPDRPGLIQAIAADWSLDFDPHHADLGAPAPDWPLPTGQRAIAPLRTLGDWVEQLEQAAAEAVEALLEHTPLPTWGPHSQAMLDWVRADLLPRLEATGQELTQLLHGLDGGYVPAGPSGAPTRGRPEVLPTGRNFYSVDLRSLPTEAAWRLGELAAERLVERYVQEEGDWPRSLGLSVWGTATMRTGGDDIAEALALLGVKPVWDGPSRRVVDFEVLPLTVLGRPRVDVTLRVSGFFRDAFPNLIDFFDRAVQAVAELDEPAEQNPLAARVREETAAAIAQGQPPEQARTEAGWRVFGSKPGAYGAGLQGLIEAQNWDSRDDLARAYLNWSSWAYGRGNPGTAAPEAFRQRLGQLQVVLQNQDNREHDLLDSDDYYQFQGGLTAAVASLRGQSPTVYFGDHSRPEQPKVRSLREELLRVYRSRVVNPKWIAGAMRHGYKGAFELAATVDYLFAYDATTGLVPDYAYDGVARAYALDPEVRSFLERHNPWALRDLSERLLEAAQRGLWGQPDPALLAQLQQGALEAEAVIESGLGGEPVES